MPEISPSRYLIQCGWDDVPHLTAKAKADMLRSVQPHTIKARSKGDPVVGPGAIYPVDKADVTIKPFKIPNYWPRAYGFDVGWKKTAAVWGAHDRDNDVIYLYAEHYRGEATPATHASSIKARGDWIPGAIDPASRGRTQTDGTQLLASYQNEKLQLFMAVNAVEAGLLECYSRFTTGRLKIFITLQNLLAELVLYRRDDKGKVIKKFDHAMDAMRYLVMTAAIMKLPPIPQMHAQGPAVGVGDLRAGY